LSCSVPTFIEKDQKVSAITFDDQR
jgi:hypothetical protein